MRTELVELPVTRYAPLPEALTVPLAEPAAPPLRCTLHGKPAVCALDALLWNLQWRQLLQRVNTDRATAACISTNPGALTQCDMGGEP